MWTSLSNWRSCARTLPFGMAKPVETLLEQDARLSARLRLPAPQAGQRGGAGWAAAVVLAHSGDSWLWMGLLGLVWLLGSPEWHSKAALLILAVGGQALVIFALKQVIRRERPQGEWGGIYRAIDPHSFPSGHATRAALLAVCAIGLGPAWLGLLLAVWSPLVSLARVATGVHYLSDILAGALLGVLMGLFALAVQGLALQIFPFMF